MADLERLGPTLDAINAASARPSPFHTSAFLRTYATYSEHIPDGIVPVVFVVSDGFDAIGWLAMRERVERLPGGLRARRLEMLAVHDNDRPGIVAVEGRELCVATAVIADLIRVERRWTMCEFRAQEQGSPLYQAVHDHRDAWLRRRDIELDPYTEVALDFADVSAYFRSLSKDMRSNVSRQARRLFAAGDVGVVTAEGGRATGALFDAYLELESRSWKHNSEVSVRRHPQREHFYRELARGRAGMLPSFVGVVLDGALVAGLFSGHFHGRSWCMEMAFDESRRDLGPGQLLLLLAIDDAIRRGSRSINFLQMQGYFKRRWLATEVPVVNVQMIRRLSVHGAKAIVGDVHRRSFDLRVAGGSATATAHRARATGNDLKRKLIADQRGTEPVAPSSLDPGRVVLRGVLAQEIAELRLLDLASVEDLLPFAVRR